MTLPEASQTRRARKISNAEVTLKSNATGATQTHTTNGQGTYRFSLLSPGAYSVSVSSSNFQVSQQTTSVTVGQTTTLNVQVQLASATVSVDVTIGGDVLQTQNADLTTSFSAEQIAQVPNPGNDLSYIVQTSPGAVMNTPREDTATQLLSEYPQPQTCLRLTEWTRTSVSEP